MNFDFNANANDEQDADSVLQWNAQNSNRDALHGISEEYPAAINSADAN